VFEVEKAVAVIIVGGVVGTLYMGGQTAHAVEESCKSLPFGAAQLCGVWESGGAAQSTFFYGTCPGVAVFLIIYWIIRTKNMSPNLMTAILLVIVFYLVVSGWRSGSATASNTATNSSFVEPTSISAQSKKVRAFLDTIAFAEGTWNGGNLAYEAAQSHPGRMKDFGEGLKSDAAGAYQFLSTTYAGLQKRYPQIKDFGSTSQDIAAQKLLEEVGSLSAIEQGDIQTAIHSACKVWASLTCNGVSGAYAQGTKADEELIKFYKERLKVYGE
jgi:lysozyme